VVTDVDPARALPSSGDGAKVGDELKAVDGRGPWAPEINLDALLDPKIGKRVGVEARRNIGTVAVLAC